MAPPADLANATLGPQALPRLRRIDVGASASAVSPPVKRIQSDADLQHWRSTRSYHDTALFVARLAEASVGKGTKRPCDTTSSLSSSIGVQSVVRLLLDLRKWTEEIEPRAGSQRFGNLAFRDWGARLQEQNGALHEVLLTDRPELKPFITELKAYLYDSFGSFVRIDYGSGHEVNFLAWLAYLYRLDFFGSHDGQETSQPTEVETDLALLVIPLYLEIVWILQDRYGLEPAGSHGVWGLDDYQFLPYILGAAQLRLQTMYKPSQISQPSHKPPSKPTPAQLLQFVPQGDSIPSPFANLFTSSIARIHALKTGPFFEHSPLLYDISTSVPNWKKVASGMLKMWDNEVVGKRPVVQHFVFGGVGYVWDELVDGEDGRAAMTTPASSTGPSSSATRVPPMAPMAATGAPWATGSATARAPPSLPATGAPWATQGTSTRASASMPPTGAPWANGSSAPTSMPATGAPWANSSAAAASLPPTAAPWARSTGTVPSRQPSNMLPPSLGPRVGKAGTASEPNGSAPSLEKH